MAKKLSSAIGIDIGSHRIKVCEMKTQGREPVVTALGMIDTPEGAVDHTGVYNSDAVGAALKQLLSESGASSPNAVVSIAGQASVLVRTLEVPRMNATELKDHMGWEINRNIPFAESTVVSDFKSLGSEDPNSPNMDVVMAIAPQSAIDTLIACLKRAGKGTTAIDVQPLSLARSLQTSYDDILGDKTVCVVDMGYKTTSINIYRGGKLLMPRQVPLGGEMFTKVIADALTLNIADAEQVKLDRGQIPRSAIESAGQTSSGFSQYGGDYQAYNPFGDDLNVPTYGQSGDPGSNPFAAPASNPFESAPDPYSAPSPYAPQEPTSYSHITDPYGVEDTATPAPPVDLTLHGDVPPAEPIPNPGQEPPVDHTLVPATEDGEVLRVYHAIAPVLDELVSEVRRSIDYYRSRGGEVNVIELSGGGTRLRGLAEYITNALHIQCDAYDPLRRLNMNAKKVAPAYAEEHRQEFAVAIGNGLHIFFD